MSSKSLFAGAALAFGGRTLVARALQAKFERDLRKISAGDHTSLLSAYADDAVLHFNEGDHRFSGQWRGRNEIERFLQNFAAARLQGQITAMAMSGWPWATTLWARFEDHAHAPDGEQLYENSSAIVLKTRWGKIVDHRDFWIDTAPITEFERKLTAHGIAPIPKTS